VELSTDVLSKTSGLDNLPFKYRLSLKVDIIKSSFHMLTKFSAKRNFQVFCIGLPRSGTHSIAYMLQKNYRTDHEPQNKRTIYHLLEWMSGKYTYSTMKNFLVWRDKKLALELESCHYMHHVVDLLMECFPQAKFIFTIRHPLTWLESEININLKTYFYRLKYWQALEAYRYGRYNFQFTKFDSSLKNIPGSYPLNSYLYYWKDHVSHVMSSVPLEKILLIKTVNIPKDIEKIAIFLGVDSKNIDIKKSNYGQVQRMFFPCQMIEQEYLYGQIEKICGDWIRFLL
jgi:Sulfotransferase domain